MADDKKAPTLELGEARDYVLILQDGTHVEGADRRPLATIVAELKRARSMVTDKDVVTWTDPILQGDEDGFGAVHFFEPLKIVGVKLDDGEGDEDDDEVDGLPLEDAQQALAAGEEEATEDVGSLFGLTPAAAPPAPE